MPGFEKSILTDVGWDALTDAEAGQHIEYTHLEAGDGFVYGGDTEIFGMTSLVNKVMDFPITNFTNDGQGQITLVGVISSKNVTTGFNFREIGVRCTIDGGPSILYAVANAGDEADYIPASSEAGVVIQTVQIIIKIDRAENVTVIVQPGLDVTAQNIGDATVGPGWFRDKIGNILWFKRVTSPKKSIIITETSDLISMDVPIIDVDLDMFVALGNPDIFPHFSTIQKALDYLKPLEIKQGIFVTIHVSAGVWLNSPAITVDHAQGTQIKIIGTSLAPKAVSTTVSAGGTNVRLNAPVGRFSDVAVGDFIYYSNNGSASMMCCSGIWPVATVAVDGSNLTYNASFRGTVPSFATNTGGTVTVLKTIIDFAPGTHGITVKNQGLGLLQYMALRGRQVAGTVIWGFRGTRGDTNAEYVGCYGWIGVASTSESYGILQQGSANLYCKNCAACTGQNGFWTQGGGLLDLTSCYGNSNLECGITLGSGNSHSYLSMACCNGQQGWLASGADAVMNNCHGYNNVQTGLYAQFNASVVTGPTHGGVFTGNSVRDITLVYVTSVIRGGGPAMQYISANIAPGVMSADGCIFSP